MSHLISEDICIYWKTVSEPLLRSHARYFLSVVLVILFDMKSLYSRYKN